MIVGCHKADGIDINYIVSYKCRDREKVVLQEWWSHKTPVSQEGSVDKFKSQITHLITKVKPNMGQVFG